MRFEILLEIFSLPSGCRRQPLLWSFARASAKEQSSRVQKSRMWGIRKVSVGSVTRYAQQPTLLLHKNIISSFLDALQEMINAHVARKYTLLALPISIRNRCERPTIMYEGLACHSNLKLLSNDWNKGGVIFLEKLYCLTINLGLLSDCHEFHGNWLHSHSNHDGYHGNHLGNHSNHNRVAPKTDLGVTLASKS